MNLLKAILPFTLKRKGTQAGDTNMYITLKFLLLYPRNASLFVFPLFFTLLHNLNPLYGTNKP